MADTDTSPDVDLASQITEAPSPEQLQALRERVQKTRDERIEAEKVSAENTEGADRLAEAKRLAQELQFEEHAKAIAEAYAADKPVPSTEEIFDVPVVEAATEPPSNGTQSATPEVPPTPPSTSTDKSDDDKSDPLNLDLTGDDQ